MEDEEKIILGIDIGTTSVKIVLVSSRRGIIEETNYKHDLLSVHTNWAEEDAEVWWANTVSGLKDIALRNPNELKKVSCIGCSGMVPAIILLDEYGKPLRNSIQQNDGRALIRLDF